MGSILINDGLKQLAKTKKALRENTLAILDVRTELEESIIECSEELIRMNYCVIKMEEFLSADPQNFQGFSDAKAKLDEGVTRCRKELLRIRAIVESMEDFLGVDPESAEIFEEIVGAFGEGEENK